MTFLCRLLLAAMLAVLAGGAVAFGPGSQLAHAATVSTPAATSPSGVQVTSDVKHDTSPPLRSLKGVPQVDLTPREQRRHPHAGPELPRGGNSATPGTGSPSVAAMPSTTSNFDGVGNDMSLNDAWNGAVARNIWVGSYNVPKAQYFFYADGNAIGSFGQLQSTDGSFKANFDAVRENLKLGIKVRTVEAA